MQQSIICSYTISTLVVLVNTRTLLMDVKEKKLCAALMMLMALSAVLTVHVSVVSRTISDACATQDQEATDAKYVSSSVKRMALSFVGFFVFQYGQIHAL